MRDLDFIAGNYLYGDLPFEKDYLRHYFTSELERLFVGYHILFGSIYEKEGFLRYYNLFQNHTGYLCSTRWLRVLLRRYKDIEKELEEAYRKTDLDMISRIKIGALFNSHRLRQL